MGKYEQPKYEVVSKSGNIEIRDYAGATVAEVALDGQRKEELEHGFKLLAGYIFGDNQARQELQLTAPLVQQSAQNLKIPMTAPVTQQGYGKVWTVRFFMPSHYQPESLPMPKDGRIKLVRVGPEKMAAIRFSGWASEKQLIERTTELRGYLNRKHMATFGEPIFAYYNPPWTLPFLRRNEVLLAISEQTD